ncbi:MAG TPA: single-stranded-DNA-specific exonuclease RecJ [Thermoanaerobaculia bacterium]|nr:single-stranded-DNA-specific exonuclease RecJ [Thermoanaerobaculia bacterium]
MAESPRWVPAPVPAAAADLEGCGFPSWMAALLARRGVADPQAAAGFLEPTLDQLHDPFLLAGMEAAVNRLLAARERGEQVAIVGDYDVDGISATALLAAVLRACHIAAQPILPDRLREGYGFQPLHVERARELGCRLILTADCGSSAGEAVAAALAAGLDVVVTDHHLPDGALPSGATQINPRQSACSYPFPDLAAAGLAFKLATALAGRCGRPPDPLPLLRIACLGTIADMVPLRGENRIIAALGLRALADSRSHGLRALIQQAGLRPPFTAADVGYRLGPRLNAAGRLHDPNRALDLLLSRDPGRALALAAELDGWNRERQSEEAKVVEQARRHLLERHPLPAILVAWSPDWHKGVVGVAAGRIAKEMHRPTVLLSVEGSVATGSGRSVPDVALHAFLAGWRPRLRRFGGHAQAIGMSLDCSLLDELRGEWERSAAASWEPAWLEKRHLYDLELPPRAVSAELVSELHRLEPFGQGNPQPLLRTGPLRLRRPPRLFGKGHLSAEAEGDDGSRIELLGWRWEERAGDLAGRFEVLAHPEIDGWHGGAVLRLVDSRSV